MQIKFTPMDGSEINENAHFQSGESRFHGALENSVNNHRDSTIFESADTQNCHFERHSIHETRPKYVCSPTRLIKRMSHLVEYNRVRRKMMFNLQAAIYSLMFILQI